MNRTMILLAALSTMATLVVGCAPEGDAPEAAGEGAPVMVTEVRTLPDGTSQVRTAEWSRAEMRAAVRERARLSAEAGAGAEPGAAGEGGEAVGEAARAIYVDRLCGPTSLWITDNLTYGDPNHMICFDDAGTMSMPSDWVGAYWGGAHTPVELWGGARSGRVWFLNSGCDAGCSVPFNAWQKRDLQAYPGASSRFDAVTLD